MEYLPKDFLLQAVLSEPDLIKFGQYRPDDYPTVDMAIDSSNEVVSVVGRIIERQNDNMTVREIYKEICNHLR